MIIRKLIADNLLKFERLELTGLPERGVIAISGANESGKSAILEAICLALFGRSFALDAGKTAKVVRWGAATAGVEMEFTGRDGSDYIIVRHFDSEGRQRARFGKKRSRFPLRGLEAVNPAVREVVGFDFPRFVETLYLPQKRSERQEGLTALPDVVGTIRALAGVSELDDVRRAYGEEITSGQRAITHISEQEKLLTRKLGELGLDPALLGRLRSRLQEEEAGAKKAHTELNQWREFAAQIAHGKSGVADAVAAFPTGDLDLTLEEWLDRLDGLDGALSRHRESCLEHSLVEVEKDPCQDLVRWLQGTRDRLDGLAAIFEDVALQRQGVAHWLGEQEGDTSGYHQERQRIQSAVASFMRWRRWHGMGSFLMTVMAAAAWGVWLGVARFPELLAPYLPTLQKALPFWDVSKSEQPLIIASGLSVVVALWLGRYLRQRYKVAGSSAELAKLESRAAAELQMAQQIDSSLGLNLPKRLAVLGNLANASWLEKLRAWREGVGAPLLSLEAWEEPRRRLVVALNKFLEEMDGLDKDVGQQASDAQAIHLRSQREAVKLQESIRLEEGRHQEAHHLQAQIAAVHELQVKEERGIRVRQAGSLLLEGASRELLVAFNHELRRHLARIVPLFTDGRFQHLQIDDTFQVTLYSAEKEGFVELAEVSTGVQQQLLLAVRFALAQALVSKAIRTAQCVIMDEPFAYFDRGRLAKTMQSMTQISDEMVQFWVTAQEFDPALPTEIQISCQQGASRLTHSKK